MIQPESLFSGEDGLRLNRLIHSSPFCSRSTGRTGIHQKTGGRDPAVPREVMMPVLTSAWLLSLVAFSFRINSPSMAIRIFPRSYRPATVRIFLLWSQIEPEPGRFSWGAVDAFLDQLEADDEAWITVCASSTWATRKAVPMLPPSPAKDLAQYRRFVGELVRHCRGRIRYWQCDNEPCIPLLWAGTASEYLDHLAAFREAVKEADPEALVVLGGAPPNAVAVHSPPHFQWAVEFFDQLLEEGAEHFDILDIHLYGDPYAIPTVIEDWRQRMGRLGYQKPIVAGEYNGPYLGQFPQFMARLGEVMQTLRDMVSGKTAVPQPDKESTCSGPTFRSRSTMDRSGSPSPPRLYSWSRSVGPGSLVAAGSTRTGPFADAPAPPKRNIGSDSSKKAIGATPLGRKHGRRRSLANQASVSVVTCKESFSHPGIPAASPEWLELRPSTVDGQELAELMIDHVLGVSTIGNYAIKTVDSDSFTEE